MLKKRDLLEIEPKIKPLVDLLNQIPYLETIASCQGHFLGLVELEKDRYLERDEYAHVIFEMPENKEKEFEQIALKILSATSPFWNDYEVELYKRYYSIPHSGELSYNWKIDIVPFEPGDYPAQQKREVTDQAISLLEIVLNESLKQ